MSRQDNNSSFKLNSGGPSIILVLVAIGLSTFAVLSVRAAYNGLRMARTSASAVTSYYAADGQCERVLYKIRELTAAGYDTDETERQLKAISEVIEVGNGCVIYEVPINETSTIHVRLQGEADYSGLVTVEHLMKVESMGEYSGTSFENSFEFY